MTTLPGLVLLASLCGPFSGTHLAGLTMGDMFRSLAEAAKERIVCLEGNTCRFCRVNITRWACPHRRKSGAVFFIQKMEVEPSGDQRRKVERNREEKKAETVAKS